jgi:hypothetical protein
MGADNPIATVECLLLADLCLTLRLSSTRIRLPTGVLNGLLAAAN